MSEEKKVIRKPIQLSPHAVAIMHIFKRRDLWEDMWMTDVDCYNEDRWDLPENAANQFMDQLDGMECMAFIIALRDRCQKEIDEWEERKKKYPLSKPSDCGNM